MLFIKRPSGMIVAALVVTFLWGSVAPAIKLGYRSLDIGAHQLGRQILYAGYIALLAAGVLFVIRMVNREPISMARSSIWPVTKMAFYQVFLNYLLFFIGISISTGTVGSIMGGTTAFFQLLFAHFLYKDEKLTRQKWTGLIIGLLGVIIVNLSHQLKFSFGLGEILLILSITAGAWGNLQARSLAGRMETGLMTAYAMLISSLGLLICGSIQVGLFPFHFSLRAGAILFYLSFLSALANLLWNLLMRLHPVSRVSLFLFLIPVFGVFISAYVLHEPLPITSFLALLLVATGILVINRPTKMEKQ